MLRRIFEKKTITLNISKLAGVPSIVFGILGLTVFVRGMELGNIVYAVGLTMSLLILLIVIVSTQEVLRAVPMYLREASYDLGATKWQMIKKVVLHFKGTYFSFISVGETAPLVVIGIPALLHPFPNGLLDKFTVPPMQIYYWMVGVSIVVLLIVLLVMNSIAVIIRNKFQKRY